MARCRTWKKQAPQCYTDFKACFSTQLTGTNRLRGTLHHSCINNRLIRLLIRRWAGARWDAVGASRLREHHRLHPAGCSPATAFVRTLGRGGGGGRPGGGGPPPPPPPSLSSLHPAGRRPATGFSRELGRGARGVRLLRQHHCLHSAGRRPAAGFGRPWGGGRWGARWRGSPMLRGRPPGSRPRQAVGCYYFFRHRNALFRHSTFSALFFSMKVAESGKIVLVSCIIDFKDKQV
jgi:hypothetical protein